MEMYTVIFEVRGGTYVSQHKVENLKDAYTESLKALGESASLSPEESTTIQAADISFVPLKGLANIWCSVIGYNHHYAYIIKTEHTVLF